jgi:hypothetical protein
MVLLGLVPLAITCCLPITATVSERARTRPVSRRALRAAISGGCGLDLVRSALRCRRPTFEPRPDGRSLRMSSDRWCLANRHGEEREAASRTMRPGARVFRPDRSARDRAADVTKKSSQACPGDGRSGACTREAVTAPPISAICRDGQKQCLDRPACLNFSRTAFCWYAMSKKGVRCRARRLESAKPTWN